MKQFTHAEMKALGGLLAVRLAQVVGRQDAADALDAIVDLSTVLLRAAHEMPELKAHTETLSILCTVAQELGVELFPDMWDRPLDRAEVVDLDDCDDCDDN